MKIYDFMKSVSAFAVSELVRCLSAASFHKGNIVNFCIMHIVIVFLLKYSISSIQYFSTFYWKFWKWRNFDSNLHHNLSSKIIPRITKLSSMYFVLQILIFWQILFFSPLPLPKQNVSNLSKIKIMFSIRECSCGLGLQTLNNIYCTSATIKFC